MEEKERGERKEGEGGKGKGRGGEGGRGRDVAPKPPDQTPPMVKWVTFMDGSHRSWVGAC